MSFSVGDDEGGYQNEPNIVPMIDILLVLLIIFMMQVPLQRKAMDVQVPPVETRQRPPPDRSTPSAKKRMEKSRVRNPPCRKCGSRFIILT